MLGYWRVAPTAEKHGGAPTDPEPPEYSGPKINGTPGMPRIQRVARAIIPLLTPYGPDA